MFITRYRSNMITFFFFFNDTATTEIYTLSLHDALPISFGFAGRRRRAALEPAWGEILFHHPAECFADFMVSDGKTYSVRSEEHTSELQSQSNLVCRLLLEKKKKTSSQCSSSNRLSLPVT